MTNIKIPQGLGYTKYHCQFCELFFTNPEHLKEHICDMHDSGRVHIDRDILAGVAGLNATLADRAKTYGNFAQAAVIIEQVKKTLRAHPKWDYLPDDVRLALEMISLKMVRAVNCFEYTDNWHDISGYAKLVEDRLNEQNNLTPQKNRE